MTLRSDGNRVPICAIRQRGNNRAKKQKYSFFIVVIVSFSILITIANIINKFDIITFSYRIVLYVLNDAFLQ